MNEIRLIGMPTRSFTQMTNFVCRFVEINKIPVPVVVINKLEDIMKEKTDSIPVVKYKDNIISLGTTTLENKRLEQLLDKVKNETKSDCRSCKNCQCSNNSIDFLNPAEK